LGWGFDFLLSDIPQMALHSHETEHWATATVLLLIGLFLLFLIEELKLKFQKIEVLETAIEVPIEGLTCGGCVNKLSKVLNADENVQKVFVSLEEHKAVIETTLSLDEIKERVKTAGFLVPS
jgi:copper chaperone CopZ